MTKEESKNLIKLLLLCIISFTLFGIGISKNKEGYGTSGKIRQELIPIINNFNSIKNIKNASFSIKAKYKNKSIIVEYNHPTQKSTYEFKYEQNGSINKIYTIYDKTEEERAKTVISNMVEAVSMTHGNYEDSIFRKYNYNNFYTTQENHGFTLVEKNGKVTATIATNVNVLKQIENILFEETKIPYISYDDLKKLQEELESKTEFNYKKGTLETYIVEKEDKYIIYLTDENNNSNDLYNSALAIINILEPTIYYEMSQMEININYNIIKKNFEIKINPEKIENNFNISGETLIQININKQSK